ncbi:MAG: CHAT domain-containing protein [Ectothiorhodospiraceae bacterium]|nr:CHAT domain-containing protein [Ectothiorhodospiraceae bacterium]
MTSEPAASRPSSTGAPCVDEDLTAAIARAARLHSSGSRDEAVRCARSALARLSPTGAAPERRAPAHDLNTLGIVLFENAYASDALVAYRAARAALDAADRSELAASLANNIGQALQAHGEPQAARVELETAVRLHAAIDPGGLAHAFALDNLGTVLAQLGELDAAEAAHRGALTMLAPAPWPAGGPFGRHVATTLGNLSNVLARRGALDAALAYRLRSLDILDRAGDRESPAHVRDVTSLADLLRRSGDAEHADRLVNAVLRIGGDTPRASHRQVAEALANLAGAALERFQLGLAERLAARALELMEALEGPAAPATIDAVYLLANVRRALGDDDAAGRGYRRAIDGYDRIGRSTRSVIAMIDLAKVFREARSLPLAETLLRDAITRLRAAPSLDAAQLASALGNLADVLVEDGRHALAARTYDEALAVLGERALGDRPWLLHNRAMLAYHLGDHDAAVRDYTEARASWVRARGDDHPFVATTDANLALVHWARGDVAAALDAFRRAETRRDHDMRRVLAVGSERQRMLYARGLQSDLGKVVGFALGAGRGNPEVERFAAQMLVRRKGRVLDAVAHTFDQMRGEADAADVAALERLRAVRTEIVALLAPSLTRGTAPSQIDRLRRLREEEERLEAAVSYRGALHGAAIGTVALDDVQAALPADAVLVDILAHRRFDPVRDGGAESWHEERYAAMVLKPDGDPAWHDLGPVEAIDAQAERWRRRLVITRISASDRETTTARELHDAVVAPLLEAIGDASTWLVSPDRGLTTAPLGLLLDATGVRLDERIALSYLTSSRELVGLRQDDRSGTGAAVVIADPSFDAAPSPVATAPTATEPVVERGGLGPLPGSRVEAEIVAALLGGATVLTGDAADTDALRTLRGPSVLHVATHGIFTPMEDVPEEPTRDLLRLTDAVVLVERRGRTAIASPMHYSGLALAGANRDGAAGILTAQQIAGLDLHGTRLVVLSACETGLGTVRQGEEFSGLRRALAIAGAQTQVTSLWKVDDDATCALMSAFYRALREGRGRAESLRRARRAIRDDAEHPQWARPFYWGAFVTSGAWGPMSLDTGGAPGADREEGGDDAH